jgi:small subunit ribosomal protein S2
MSNENENIEENSGEEKFQQKEKKAGEPQEQSTDGLLVPTEKYLKSGLHIGTKFKTKFMEQFIYKIRPDGLSVLNLKKIDERILICANFLSHYDPSDIIIVSRRENGWRAVKMFGRLTGCRVFAGRYPPGILTNNALSNFIEAKVILVTDPWPDRNVVDDAKKIGIPVIALCDTNNPCNNIDLVVPCNNKGKKSLGLFFWILTKLFLQKKGLFPEGAELKETPEDFAGE